LLVLTYQIKQNMKNLLIASMMMFAGVVFAQDNNAQHVVVDQMVKSTFYFENGQVKQEGFYKDGKVHGQWISYDINGNKVSMGQFENGIKTGKWFFWTGSDLSEVDFTDSRIAQVKKWSQGSLVDRN
jgi:hypothetical protein